MGNLKSPIGNARAIGNRQSAVLTFPLAIAIIDCSMCLPLPD
jgi:hypothetical protein